MRVIFTRNTRPSEGGPFHQGDVVDLEGPSLKRWQRRGAVEPAPAEPETVETAETETADKAPARPPKPDGGRRRKPKPQPSEE